MPGKASRLQGEKSTSGMCGRAGQQAKRDGNRAGVSLRYMNWGLGFLVLL